MFPAGLQSSRAVHAARGACQEVVSRVLRIGTLPCLGDNAGFHLLKRCGTARQTLPRSLPFEAGKGRGRRRHRAKARLELHGASHDPRRRGRVRTAACARPPIASPGALKQHAECRSKSRVGVGKERIETDEQVHRLLQEGMAYVLFCLERIVVSLPVHHAASAHGLGWRERSTGPGGCSSSRQVRLAVLLRRPGRPGMTSRQRVLAVRFHRRGSGSAALVAAPRRRRSCWRRFCFESSSHSSSEASGSCRAADGVVVHRPRPGCSGRALQRSSDFLRRPARCWPIKMFGSSAGLATESGSAESLGQPSMACCGQCPIFAPARQRHASPSNPRHQTLPGRAGIFA